MGQADNAEDLRRKQARDDMVAVMGTFAGRRFVWRLMGDAGCFRSSFVAGYPDTTAFNEGARNFGLSLLAEIMTDAPEAFLTMQKEAMDDEQARRNEADHNSRGNDSDHGRGEW